MLIPTFHHFVANFVIILCCFLFTCWFRTIRFPSLPINGSHCFLPLHYILLLPILNRTITSSYITFWVLLRSCSSQLGVSSLFHFISLHLKIQSQTFKIYTLEPTKREISLCYCVIIWPLPSLLGPNFFFF